MNDGERIAAAIASVVDESGTVGEETARLIASRWHGGQWTALYAFSSTGHVSEGLAEEVAAELRAPGLDHDDWCELAALEQYVAEQCTGERYHVNPDYPDEGTDIHHDGDCPIHPAV